MPFSTAPRFCRYPEAPAHFIVPPVMTSTPLNSPALAGLRSPTVEVARNRSPSLVWRTDVEMTSVRPVVPEGAVLCAVRSRVPLRLPFRSPLTQKPTGELQPGPFVNTAVKGPLTFTTLGDAPARPATRAPDATVAASSTDTGMRRRQRPLVYADMIRSFRS